MSAISEAASNNRGRPQLPEWLMGPGGIAADPGVTRRAKQDRAFAVAAIAILMKNQHAAGVLGLWDPEVIRRPRFCVLAELGRLATDSLGLGPVPPSDDAAAAMLAVVATLGANPGLTAKQAVALVRAARGRRTRERVAALCKQIRGYT